MAKVKSLERWSHLRWLRDTNIIIFSADDDDWRRFRWLADSLWKQMLKSFRFFQLRAQLNHDIFIILHPPVSRHFVYFKHLFYLYQHFVRKTKLCSVDVLFLLFLSFLGKKRFFRVFWWQWHNICIKAINMK